MRRPSLKIRITAWFALMMFVIEALVLSFLLAVNGTIVTNDPESRLVRMVEHNADRVKYKNRQFRYDHIHYYRSGVYTVLYDADGNPLQGTFPAEFSPAQPLPLSGDAVRTVTCGEQTFYVYDVHVDMMVGSVWLRGVIDANAKGGVMRVIMPLAWSLLPVLLVLSAVILFRMNSKLPKGPVEVPLSQLLNWNDKGSLFGILAGGCVMAFSGVLEIANAFGRTVTAVSADGMEIVTVSAGAGRSGVVMGLLAVVAGICLLAGVAICRKTPDTEPQILLAVPVLLLARLIFAYRLYSVDPVLANYYLELLGLMLLILASYRLSGFAVQAGGPRMFGFYADLTAILAVTLLADGHSAALLPLGGAAALDGFQRAMRMSGAAKGKTEE